MGRLVRVARSFGFAFQGLRYLLATQTNFWVHSLAAGGALLLALVLDIRGAELAAILLAIGLVLAAEALNTALEAVVDLVSPGHHPLAKAAKDAGAAGVLLAALAAALVGIVIFGGRLVGPGGR